MDPQTLKDEIRKLIAANQIEEAIERLASAQFSALDKQLIVLNSQYNRVREEMRLNLISKDEGERRMNTITMALIDLSEKIGEKPGVLPDHLPGVKWTKGRLVLVILVPLLVIALYVFFNVLKPDPAEQPTAGESAEVAEQQAVNNLGNDSMKAVDQQADNNLVVEKVDPIALQIQALIQKQTEWLKKLPEQPVAAYFFNGDSLDAKGAFHPAICTAKSKTDVEENALQRAYYWFDGKMAHIQLPDILKAEDIKRPFSIACWVNLEKGSGAIFGNYVYSKGDKSQVVANYHCLELEGGCPLLKEFKQPLSGKPTNCLELGEWTHLVVGREAGRDFLYINGKKQLLDNLIDERARLITETAANVAWQTILIVKGPTYSFIGGHPIGEYKSGNYEVGNSFKGGLDDLFIFDRAISPQTVWQLYLGHDGQK
ncbi:MAG: hypothetical protein EP344_15275 [Bacteroidetes bacterium]|nr:MAG: hypothetical protein EP344_15275 [Bacteroidota bacterium]